MREPAILDLRLRLTSDSRRPLLEPPPVLTTT
jgi:hypothetical protein